MKNQFFDTVVKKIGKYKGKLLSVEHLKKQVGDILGDDYTDQKLYKMIYYLKNRGHLQPLKKDIYFVKSPESSFSDQQLLELFYRNIVKQHCNKYLASDRYIGGIKALELNLSSHEVPDELLIVNSYKQSTEILMFDKQIIFKKYYAEDQKLYKMFSKFTQKLYIKNNVFLVANLELALLESLYNTPLLSQGYVTELVKKVLRKHKTSFDMKIREKILMNSKHHSSMSRLYKIAQTIDPVLADQIKKVIKRFSYFVTV